LAFLSNPYENESTDWEMWRNGWLDAVNKNRVDHYLEGNAVSVVDEAIRGVHIAISKAGP